MRVHTYSWPMAGVTAWAAIDVAELAAWSTAAQAALVFVALVVAWVQLKDARDDRNARDRPFVVVEFDGERNHEEVDIVVRNIGATIARDIRIRFDPPLKTSLDDTGYGAAHMKAFSEGIPALTPGQSLRALFDTGPARFDSDLPAQYEASLSYSGDLRNAEPYLETLSLDLDLLKSRLYVDRKTVHDVHRELKAIRELLAKQGTSRGSRDRPDDA